MVQALNRMSPCRDDRPGTTARSTYEPVREYFKAIGGKPMGKDHPCAGLTSPVAGDSFCII